MRQKRNFKKCVICGRRREIVSDYPIAGACFDCAMRFLFYAMFLIMGRSMLSDPDQVPGLAELLSSIDRKHGLK